MEEAMEEVMEEAMEEAMEGVMDAVAEEVTDAVAEEVTDAVAEEATDAVAEEDNDNGFPFLWKRVFLQTSSFAEVLMTLKIKHQKTRCQYRVRNVYAHIS